MGFLRTDKKGNNEYLRIVHNYRKDGKVLQKTLYNLGKKDDYSNEQLINIGKKFLELGGEKLSNFIDKNTREIGRFNYGFYQLYSKLLKHYNLDKLLQKIEKKHKLEIDLVNSLLLMLLERLNDPSSKLRNYFNQDEYLGIKAVDLHHLYRSLDYLADNQEAIQENIFFTGRNLFNLTLDVVFYDVTTFYFDTERQAGLLEHGFGKDGKIGQSQIVFSLLIDKNKQPIAYHIYKGSFYEGHTFEDAIATLKKKYSIDKVIVVADRGMMSSTNLEVVQKYQGYEFVIGERLRNLPKVVINYLTDRSNYTQSWIYKKDKEEIKVEYTSIEYKDRKIICTYSSKRAAKDSYDRQQRVEKGKKLLKNQSQISKKASRYFLEKNGKDEYSLNESKIIADAQFDGFIAIATNNKELPETLLLDHYKHLYQIEHSFRSFKSHLETRPMFHWTDKRIEGHLCLCYIAYTLNTFALNTLKEHSESITEDSLRRALNKMQVSLIEQDKEKYYLRSINDKNAEKITEIFKLKKLPHLLPKSNIINYL